MKTAFVTGATGFLGMNLAALLREAGWRVVAIHRPASRLSELRNLGVELAPGAIDDPASLERAMPEGVDAVFHVAGNTSMWSRNDAVQTRDNVEGTRNVAAAAQARGARRMVYTSSVVVHGLGDFRATEETPSAGRLRGLDAGRWAAEELAGSGPAARVPTTFPPSTRRRGTPRERARDENSASPSRVALTPPRRARAIMSS